MSVKNFIPTLWAEKIDMALDEFLVFFDGCNHEYEGQLKKAGDSIRIQNVARPTITTTTDGAEITLSAGGPEKPEVTSVTMPVKRQTYFDYGIYDVDKAQAAGDLDAALKHETTQGVANDIDLAIAGVVNDKGARKAFGTGGIYSSFNSGAVPTVVAGTASSGEINVLEALDMAQQALYEQNVPTSEYVEVIVTPRFYTLFRRAYTKLDTGNSEILKNGKVGMYGNMTVKLSNNVQKATTTTTGDTDLIMVRTKKAIAAVKTLSKVEAYRPERGFIDAVKGLTVHDRKLVRPKELVVLNVAY
jgi:hypothetical protein